MTSNSSLDDDSERLLMSLSIGTLTAQMVYCVAKLGIADKLRDGPVKCSVLAKQIQASPEGLYRLLRSLSAMGVFDEGETGEFALNSTSELLRSDSPRSVLDMVYLFGADWHVRTFAALEYSVRTGRPSFEKLYGKALFEYLSENPESSRVFDRGMRRLAADAVRYIPDAYDFSRFRSVVDIGGGTVELLAAVMVKYPQIQGILFERPDVIAVITRAPNVATDRFKVVGGDFLEGVPEGADLYVLKNVIHDWDDTKAVQILSNCRRAMNERGRVALNEAVIGPTGQTFFGKLMDIWMLTTTGGIERTEQQYAEILQCAGMRLVRVSPTPTPYSVIEAERT